MQLRRKLNSKFLILFGLKKTMTSQRKLLVFGWRFIFLIFTAFFILSGFSPLSFLRSTIKALNGKTEKINFYSKLVAVNEIDSKYNGWQNVENALGSADLGPDATLQIFSSNQAAFYQGGDHSFVLSGFSLLEEKDLVDTVEEEHVEEDKVDVKTIKDNEQSLEELVEDDENVNEMDESEQVVEESLEDDEKEEMDDGKQMTEEILSEDEEINQELAEVIVVEEIEDASETIEEIEIKEVESIEVIIYEKKIQELKEIEIIEEELYEELIIEEETIDKENVSTQEEVSEKKNDVKEIAPIVEQESEAYLDSDEIIETKEEEKSAFFERLRDVFSIFIAKAKETIFTDIVDINDLGEFKSAKINFSLAMNSGKTKIKGKQNSISEFDDIVSMQEETVDEDIDITAEDEDDSDNNIDMDEDEIIVEEIEIESDIDELIDKEIFSEEVIEEIEIVNQPEDNVSEVEVVEEIKEKEVSFNKILSNLFLPYMANAQADEFFEDAKLIIWYSVEQTDSDIDNTNNINDEDLKTEAVLDNGRLWKKLDTITANSISNASNGGYFSYEACFLESWEDISDLQLKFSGVYKGETVFFLYLDSAWVEVEYDPESEQEKLEKRKRWEEALEYLSGRQVFSPGEKGELRFQYNKNENRIWDTLSEFIGLGNYWKDVDFKVSLVDSSGQTVESGLVTFFESDGEIVVLLPQDMRAMKPGKYTLLFHIEDNSGEEAEIFDFRHNFSWGVLAMNFNKSIYRQDEDGFVQIAVLDENGHTICDADIVLSVRSFSGTDIFSTENGLIKKNPACGPKSITDKPDYYAYYNFSGRGNYKFTLEATTKSGIKSIDETIKVKGIVDFEVERIGPTRIFPQADYSMKIVIEANEDYKGDLVEYAPSGFKVVNQELRIMNQADRDAYGSEFRFSEETGDSEKRLIWQDIEIMKGDVL
ncbi:hypothetical protein K8R32_03910, partial [bacterium]|nr:hypothetical protein [bacterium]